jgi:tRNA U34 5-methylaminomethyl-2-thiouridine-forming methyltransferase MnmC
MGTVFITNVHALPVNRGLNQASNYNTFFGGKREMLRIIKSPPASLC